MDYEKLRTKPSQFLSLTSLTVLEFDYLLFHFQSKWESYYRYHRLDGKKRVHPRRKEHGSAKLPGTALKLFFLLVYLKNNSLQETQAASFNISQPKASKISRVLLEILNQTLKSMDLLPCRNGAELKTVLADHQDKIFSFDGTDRGLLRNQDSEAQKKEYSGKHHQHGMKNNLLSDDDQYVYYLSVTVPGSMHDKALADFDPLDLPDNSVIRLDLGYTGLVLNETITVEIPYKKPKNGELSFSQKLYNKMLSSTRVVVEHANSGIKRLRIVKDTIRIHSTEVRDKVMSVACGLHNLRVRSNQRAYTSS